MKWIRWDDETVPDNIVGGYEKFLCWYKGVVMQAIVARPHKYRKIIFYIYNPFVESGRIEVDHDLMDPKDFIVWWMPFPEEPNE
jgi:hypothetical protein